MLTYWETLTAIQSNVPVNDSYAQLWGRKSQSGYAVVTFTGTLPATLTGTKAGYLHRYKIYGNTVQDGTPTPENPIEPQECGERTENLFDVQDFTYTGEQPQQRPLLWEGTLPAGTYTVSVMQESELISSVRNTIIVNVNGVARYESSIENYHDNAGLHKMTFNVNDGDVVGIYYWAHTLSNPCTYSNAMLNTGSTALPYEPHGYKLPLSSAGQSVDIYLGESQTTRRIKKLVLTGEEQWGYNSSNRTAYLTVLGSVLGEGVSVVSTHYTAVSNKTAYSQLSDKQCCLRKNDNYLWVRDNDYSTVEDFKAYLAQQYANGTPVTVWYVLETPQTATLNEPLRKIGNYADAIDSAQTSAQIPTSASSTTISWAGEGLAPSQVELEYEKKR